MSKPVITNMDIVLYALYLLGGNENKIFTEDIALRSFEIDRTRFSWRRYPQYPDLEPTRRILISARDDKGLIRGRAGEVKGEKLSDGWIFSPKGIDWVESNKERVSNLLDVKLPSSSRTTHSRILNDLKKTTAFQKYSKDKNCKNIEPFEFTDCLNAGLDSPAAILRDRLNKISTKAANEKENVVLTFLQACETYFSKELKL